MTERAYEHERGQRPDEVSAKRIAKEADLYGVHVVAKRVGTSKESVARFVARMPMYSGTLQKFSDYLRSVRQ